MPDLKESDIENPEALKSINAADIENPEALKASEPGLAETLYNTGGELIGGLYGVAKGTMNAATGFGNMLYETAMGRAPQLEMRRQADITQRLAQTPDPLSRAGLQAERIPFIGPIGAGLYKTAKAGLTGTTEEFGTALGENVVP